MSAPVEAQSLSNLTYLFANPPQYPRNPTHEVHPPLTLYIVRVPGSKDVFLSPLKPPTKASISLESIQSSLYYLHVPTDEDEQVRRSYEQQRRSEESQRPSAAVTRKPVAAHPLPPLPLQEQSVNGRDWQGHADGLRLNTKLPSYHTYEVSNDYTTSPYDRGSPAALPTIREPPKRDPRSKAITLIRRDPASSSQWNIGSITLLEPTFAGSTMRPVSVELSTPGYLHFNHSTYNTPASAGSNLEAIRQAIDLAESSPPTTNVDPTIFSRTVDFRRMALSELQRTVYQRTNSNDSMNRSNNKPVLEKSVLAFDSPWFGQCTFVNGIDGNSLKLKHTVKGTSSTADSQTANIAEIRFNLGWSVLNNRSKNEPDKIPIPDLIQTKKENLRRSFQHIKEKSRESIKRKDDPFRELSNLQTPLESNLEKPSSHASAASSIAPGSENEDERISLRLGREKAGGGFRGHSAKLGKLIIEDEGLKMCDLVVAAAMGIWWQHYEQALT